MGAFGVLGLVFRPILRWAVARFGRRYDYDASYQLVMLERSPGAFVGFSTVGAAAQLRVAAPVDAWFAAKLAAAMSEDCGPCTQLVVRMAREQGVAPEQVRAVLERDERAMSSDVRLALRFADALIGRGPELDPARDEVRSRWGDAAVIDLALAVALSRVFPTVKAGLGFARECRLVTVDEQPVVVRHASAGG